VHHGPGAVRVLIYRLCDSRERVQSTVRNPLERGLPRPSSKKICDTAVTSRLPTASEIGDFELKIGRGPGI
jgi:hypothetical protein